MSLLVDGIKQQTRPVCADGWTLSADELSCSRFISTSAELIGGDDKLVKHYTLASDYTVWGTVFYKPNTVNSYGGWTYTEGDTATYANYYNKTNYAASGSGVFFTYFDNTLWNNTTLNDLQGRLNKCGIWLSTSQVYVGTLGFSRQFTIPTDGYYYIGVGVDNYATIKIDGTTIIAQAMSSIGTQFGQSTNYDKCAFRLWHMYPMYLTAGNHIISITATNTGSYGILGTEIYNGTEAQLLACTTEDQLDTYTIFSTKNVLDGEKFDIGNYYCSDTSYELVNIGGVYSCQKIETTNPNYI